MPWINKNGKGTWFEFPWYTDPDFKQKMMEKGKGPNTWYRFNTWEVQFEQLGNKTFKVGEGTNQFEFPSYSHTDERRQLIAAEAIIGKSTRNKRIWSETEGLLADPLNQHRGAFVTYKGSWVDQGDLSLRSREVEILGIIDANPRIRIKQLALIYNTSSRNIMRIFMVAHAAGVCFSNLQFGRVSINNWGIYDQAKVRKLFKSSMGLDQIVASAKTVLNSDSTDERTGKLDLDNVKKQLGELWEKKLAEEKAREL